MTAKILKLNCDIISPILCADFNDGISNNVFPDIMQLAEIIPIFIKGDRTNKENYRGVSLLSEASKIYEKILYEQINGYFDTLLSNIQCGFRKGHSSQHSLLVLIEKWRQSLDLNQSAGFLLTDLSKAFDCIRHDLLIAKCYAYGVDRKSVSYLCDYLSNRKQRVKINNDYSEWRDVKYGVPQGSILGPPF